jgi:hypothetical protein
VANYVKATNFAVKDSLLTGNPAKLVKGTEIDTEFNAIASAIATKVDTTVATLVLTNLTTDNFLLGTQTGKATISYTTNASRTLTIPAVAGNRTFAFIDEAQTFSTNQTVAANLIFSGDSRRVQAKYLGYDSTATLFQNGTTNTGTSVGAIPNGTAINAAFVVYNSTDPGNASAAGVYVDNDEVSFFSTQAGTGSYQPVYISNGGVARIQINSNGSMAFGGTTPDSNTSVVITAGGKTTTLSADGEIKFTSAYSKTVGGTNRSLFIDNTGVIGGLSSTRESKANITTIDNADWLMALEPVTYNRRKRDSNGNYTNEVYDNTEFGLIADDVAVVKPEVCVFVDGKVSGINYEQLISPMLKEIQKLRAEVEALKAKGI